MDDDKKLIGYKPANDYSHFLKFSKIDSDISSELYEVVSKFFVFASNIDKSYIEKNKII